VATLETMLGGGEPGQVEGHLVPAEMVRELAYALGLMPRPAPALDGLPDVSDLPVAAEVPVDETEAGTAPSRNDVTSSTWGADRRA
jgi:hypothetical protein